MQCIGYGSGGIRIKRWSRDYPVSSRCG